MSAALLARLGAATGPDRVLDALLDIACAQTRPEWAQDTGTLTPDGDCVRLSPTGTVTIFTGTLAPFGAPTIR